MIVKNNTILLYIDILESKSSEYAVLFAVDCPLHHLG